MRKALGALVAALALAGCGLNVEEPDLFLLSRIGPAGTLTLLVNSGGTVRCDGGESRPLSDPLLLRARDLADELESDAKAKLRIPFTHASVYRFKIRLQEGTIYFPDTAARQHPPLAQAELFALQAAHQACGIAS